VEGSRTDDIPQPQGFLALPSAGKEKDLEEGARNDHKHREFVLK
jgi:hypothetical protein